MSVKVKIFHTELERVIDSPGEVRVEEKTVGECLHDLVRQYPGAERLMFEANGKLLKRFYVFVNAEGMAKANFSRPVTDKDGLILVVLAAAGKRGAKHSVAIRAITRGWGRFRG